MLGIAQPDCELLGHAAPKRRTSPPTRGIPEGLRLPSVKGARASTPWEMGLPSILEALRRKP